MFHDRPGLTNFSLPIFELTGGGPAKGIKYLTKMGRKYPGSISSVEKIGSKFWKYTTKVFAKNGNKSFTIHTKIMNAEGKTLKYFHDTFDKTHRFIHRGWTEGSTKVHLWWNGIKQYGDDFFKSIR